MNIHVLHPIITTINPSFKKIQTKLGVVAHTFNPSTQEAEANSEFEASMVYKS